MVERDEPVAEQHPDRLDGVERDALGALEDALHDRRREPGHKAGEELAHLLGRQRLEHQRREAPPPGSPIVPAVEQLGPGRGDDVDRALAGPVEDVIDEVEEPVVGPLEILEHEDDHPALGDPFEQEAPGGEQRFAVGGLRDLARLDAEQLEETRLHPASLRLVCHEFAEGAVQLSACGGRVILVADPDPAANHLGQCPEADADPIRR